MKRIFKFALIAMVLLFAGLQFVRPDRTNPPVNPADSIEAATILPDDINSMLERSCKDCHSNETIHPWYSNISPFSWFLADHISEGRRQLNLSIWGTYGDREKVHRLEEICEVLEAGEMPLSSYLWIHRDAVLTEADSNMLCSWAQSEKARLAH